MRYPSKLAILLCAAGSAALPFREARVRVAWSGAQCLLSGTFAPATGARTVELDFEGDGTIEARRELDASGRFFAAAPATLAALGNVMVTARDATGNVVGTEVIDLEREAEDSASNALADGAPGNIPAALCTCNASGMAADIDSTLALTSSREAAAHGVSLVDGAVVTPVHVFDFGTVGHRVQFILYHHSLTTYAGPVGNATSHTFNTFIVQDDATHGRLVTPDLRVFPIVQGAGNEWTLPAGIHGRLVRDTARGLWVLTHHTGETYEYVVGVQSLPGNLVAIADTNANRLSLSYDASGRLTSIMTPTSQRVRLGYNVNGQLASITDPIGRRWALSYRNGQLTTITTPRTEVTTASVTIATNATTVADSLTTQALTLTLEYADAAHPTHLTGIRNGAGQRVLTMRYDQAGRVAGRGFGTAEATFVYDDALFDGTGQPNASRVPRARVKLEPGNVVTRIVDRVGNVADVEMHGAGGGPLGGAGKFGVRRVVQWTERGIGRPPLRADEPDWWERRWLHDSDSLTPKQVSAALRSDSGATFDDLGMPVGRTSEHYTYNQWRQVTAYVRTDGAQSMRWERTYQPFDPAHGLFSRLLSDTGERAFSNSPLDAGLGFATTYEYDSAGNLVLLRHPTVQRGQPTAQVAVQMFVRNPRGQLLLHQNANGDLTEFEYFTASQASTDINVQGTFDGYLAAVTRGIAGSRNPVVGRREGFLVNNLGMVTAHVDAAQQRWTTQYTALGQIARETSPAVELGSSSQPVARVHLYDRAGQRSLDRHQNVDHDGAARPNAWIDTVYTRDARGNAIGVRKEVDQDPANDVVTRFAFDANDQPIAAMEPLGNRVMRTWDERHLPLREFAGVAAPTDGNILQGSPSRAATTLAVSYLSSAEYGFDADGHLVRQRDGRGNDALRIYDALGRAIAVRDANGNGTRMEYDAAGNPVTIASGSLTIAGELSTVLGRSYRRYDERDRNYLEVRDADLDSDESLLVDPRAAGSAVRAVQFDGQQRVQTESDQRGIVRQVAFDAVGAPLAETDAVGNRREWTYDVLGQIAAVRIFDAGSAAPNVPAVANLTFDTLGRLRRTETLGTGSAQTAVVQRFTYDSLGFRRTAVDGEGTIRERTRDDLLRVVGETQLDRDGALLARNTQAWDANSRLVAETDAMGFGTPPRAQTRRYAWDAMNRQIRRVDTDSDDPIDGAHNGADGIFDRMTWTWDANSNIVAMTDERGATKAAGYDAGNRLTESAVSGTGVIGAMRERFTYDALGRATEKANDVSRILRTYDPLGFIVSETQSVRLDGSGFTRGWQDPVSLTVDRDPAGNMLQWSVRSAGTVDLAVTNTFDALHRLVTVDASYLNGSRAHRVASLEYLGADRLQRVTYGNGANWEAQFDVLGRTASATWSTRDGDVLAGHAFAFDQVGRPLWDRAVHDGDRHDVFGYDAAHQLTGVDYRATAPSDYRTRATAYGSSWAYDARGNRTASTETDPFGGQRTDTAYEIGAGNDYASISRGTAVTPLEFDRFGAAMRLPVTPRTGSAAGEELTAQAGYDVHAQMNSLEVGGAQYHYAYDAERRRIAAWSTDAQGRVVSGDRFVLVGPNEVVERRLQTGVAVGDAASRTRRVFVPGDHIDQVFFAAVDGDADGAVRSIDADPYSYEGASTSDFAYYLLGNAIGSPEALVHADDSARVLEYFEYGAFGELTVLPIVDGNGDSREDTPLDLADNHARMLALRSTRGDASIGRFSRVGNAIAFAGRRLDPESGLVHMRMRHYDPALGRFTSRDWAEEIAPGRHPYAYALNQPGVFTDPLGLEAEFKLTLSYSVTKVLNCPEYTEGTVAASLSGSTEMTSPPLVFGLTAVITLTVQFTGSATARECTKPYCLQLLGPLKLEGGATLSISLGYGIGDWARAEIGVRGSAKTSAQYDVCKGQGKTQSELSAEVYGRVFVDTWVGEFEHEISTSLGSKSIENSFTGPKLDCTACSCCPEDDSGPRVTTTISASVWQSPQGDDLMRTLKDPRSSGAGARSLTPAQRRRGTDEVWALLCLACCR